LTQADYTPVGVPVIRGSNMEAAGRYLGGEYAFISEAKLHRDLASNIAKPGDIVVTQRGTLGQVGIIPSKPFDRYVISQSQMAISCDTSKCSALFVYYFLRAPQFLSYLEAETIQVGVPHINVGLLRNVTTQWPQLAEQENIAAILGALDDKIELNRRMNETLEAIARAIFKDWFMDFGPTRAKAEGSAPYLAPEIWALFPARLDDEDKPEGWRVMRLAEIAEQCKGSVSPSRQPDRLYEHFSLPAFDTGQVPAADLGESIKSNKTPVAKGAVLLSKLNPEIRRVWIPNEPGEAPQIASTEFLIFKAKAPAGRGLLYCLFHSSTFRQMLEGMGTDTSKSHQRISPPALLEAEVLSGSPDTIGAFEMAVAPLLAGLLVNRTESCTLSITRDLLLPKLMSGEIRLREAEKIVEAVA
jgi:type I restriction enzyme, S subunit